MKNLSALVLLLLMIAIIISAVGCAPKEAPLQTFGCSEWLSHSISLLVLERVNDDGYWHILITAESALAS